MGLCRLLLSHLIKCLGVGAADLTGHIHPHERHGGTGIGIGGRHFHGVALTGHQMRGAPSGVDKGRIALELLDGLFVLLIGGDAGNAAGDDLHAPQLPPFGAENLVQRVGQLHGVTGEGGVADAQFADFGKGGLEGGEQLRFQLAVQRGAGIVLRHVAADIGVKQQGVGDMVTVLAEAANAHIHVDTGSLVHHPEGNGTGGAVFIAGDLLGVDIIDALVLGGLAAEGKALADVLEHLSDALAQMAGENAGLRGGVIDKFAGLGADLRHLALIHNEHTLSVRHGNDRAGGDDVLIALIVAGTARDLFAALHRQRIGAQRLTVKIFLPLVRQHAAGGTGCRFDQSHGTFSFRGRAAVRDLSPLYSTAAAVTTKKSAEGRSFRQSGNRFVPPLQIFGAAKKP